MGSPYWLTAVPSITPSGVSLMTAPAEEGMLTVLSSSGSPGCGITTNPGFRACRKYWPLLNPVKLYSPLEPAMVVRTSGWAGPSVCSGTLDRLIIAPLIGSPVTEFLTVPLSELSPCALSAISATGVNAINRTARMDHSISNSHDDVINKKSERNRSEGCAFEKTSSTAF